MSAFCSYLTFSILTPGTRRSVLFVGKRARVKLVCLVLFVGIILVGVRLVIGNLEWHCIDLFVSSSSSMCPTCLGLSMV